PATEVITLFSGARHALEVARPGTDRLRGPPLWGCRRAAEEGQTRAAGGLARGLPETARLSADLHGPGGRGRQGAEEGQPAGQVRMDGWGRAPARGDPGPRPGLQGPPRGGEARQRSGQAAAGEGRQTDRLALGPEAGGGQGPLGSAAAAGGPSRRGSGADLRG